MLATSLILLSMTLAVFGCEGHSTTTKAAARATSTKASSTKVSSTRMVTLTKAAATSTGSWWKPTLSDKFLYAINDPNVPTNPKSSSGIALKQNVYIVDLFDTSAATIKRYHNEGKKVVCYFSAGSYEDWRDDKADFDPKCYCNKGSSCALDDWEGEWWLDLTSTCRANVQKVTGARLKMAADNGCDAVDPDNVDSYTNKPGFKTTEADQLQYLQFMSDRSHELGMAIGLKNGGDMLRNHEKEILVAFDFSIIEQCQEWNECDVYKPFIGPKKPATDFEYKSSAKCGASGLDVLRYKTLGLSYKNVVQTC